MGKGKWIVLILAAGCLVILANPVMATIGEKPYVDTKNSGLELSGFISKSEITYKYLDDTVLHGKDDTFNVERMLIGLTLSKGVNNKLNIYGTFNYLFDGTYNDEDHRLGGGVENLDHDKDNGYMLSAGAKYMVIQSGKLSGHINGQIDYIIEEKYSGDYRIATGGGPHNATGEVELSGYEFTLGACLKYELDTNFAAYASLSLAPLMDLSYDYKLSGTRLRTYTSDGDIEREDMIGFRIGASYDFSGSTWFARGEIDFGNEQAFVLSCGTRF